MPRKAELPEEHLYTIPELAARWQLDRTTVERAMRRGELRYVRVGARRRIPASAVEEYERPPLALA